MIAPNGARKQKKDVPNIPLSMDELVSEAINCELAGAHGIHLHMRDAKYNHSLDHDSYDRCIKKTPIAN